MSTRSIGGGALFLVLSLAQAAEGQVSISPYAGAMIYDGSMMLYEGGVRQGPGIEDDPPVAVLGLRVGYEIFGQAELEASYGRSWLRNRPGDVASHLYHAMLRYPVMSSGAWLVHLVGGAGWITYRSAADQVRSLSDRTVTGGLGLSYRISPRLDLRTDLAFIGQFCNEPDQQDGLACNDGSQLGYTQLSAGLRIRPGSRP